MIEVHLLSFPVNVSMSLNNIRMYKHVYCSEVLKVSALWNLNRYKFPRVSLYPTTDIQGRSHPALFFPPAWGSNWGSSGFSRNQNNRDLSGAYVTCIDCSLSMKINTRKTPHGRRRLWMHLFCICFCMCGRQNPKTLNLSPMADITITQGCIQGLESLLYICVSNSIFF